MRFPITVYQEEPSTNRFAEYHEVTYARDSKEGGFALIDVHGWWEDEDGTPHENRKVLYEAFKSEQEASAAMDERVAWLVGQGWNIKFTSEFDPSAGSFVPVRIP